MNTINRRLGTILIAVGVVAALAGCATAIAADGEGQEVFSTNCGVGLIYEWDATPGSDTRLEELEILLAGIREAAESLPPIEDVPADSERVATPEDDPVLSMVAIRGLEALIAALPEAEEGVAADETLDYEAFTDGGQRIASVTITLHYGGGYHIDRIGFVGWLSDHPSCVE